ncbi:hypothetical protein PMAYCL1PPCAC_14160, partial [Pristionchus mayeri]
SRILHIFSYHITEYCGPDLETIIAKGGYAMEHVKSWMRDLLSALKYINSLGISHRNLKPKKMCINMNGDKIGKLTLTGIKSPDLRNNKTGSRGHEPYKAIEVHVEWKDKDYDEKVDIWSMAVIFCELLTGVSLFSGPNFKNVLKVMIQLCGPVDEAVLKK